MASASASIRPGFSISDAVMSVLSYLQLRFQPPKCEIVNFVPEVQAAALILPVNHDPKTRLPRRDERIFMAHARAVMGMYSVLLHSDVRAFLSIPPDHYAAADQTTVRVLCEGYNVGLLRVLWYLSYHHENISEAHDIMTLFRALLWLQMVTPACCGQTASAIVDLFDLQQPPHVFHGSFNTEVFLALEALGHQAPDVIEVLIKGAQSVFASDTRSAGLIAIRALGTLARGSEEARAAMKRLLDRVGDDAEVRGACIASLAQIRGRD